MLLQKTILNIIDNLKYFLIFYIEKNLNIIKLKIYFN